MKGSVREYNSISIATNFTFIYCICKEKIVKIEELSPMVKFTYSCISDRKNSIKFKTTYSYITTYNCRMQFDAYRIKYKIFV